jgi:hypothetical protein
MHDAPLTKGQPDPYCELCEAGEPPIRTDLRGWGGRGRVQHRVLTELEVDEVFRYADMGAPLRWIADRMGISKSTVDRTLRGETGYSRRYKRSTWRPRGSQ